MPLEHVNSMRSKIFDVSIKSFSAIGVATGYTPSDRGTGYHFGSSAFHSFLQAFNFSAMIRGHEVCNRGCRVHFGSCWTVFSHPRYIGLRNVAGALKVLDDLSMVPQMFPYAEVDLEGVARYPLIAEDEASDDEISREVESVMEWGDDGEDLNDEDLEALVRASTSTGSTGLTASLASDSSVR
jgi:hypothetical protein